MNPQKILVTLALAGLSVLALAQTPSLTAAPAASPVVAAAIHPWQRPAPRVNTEAYFTNLQDGAKIETPFRIGFGLSGGWGLAPISKPMGGKSGHHHLLINRDLPLDFKQALPFNEQYIHFGKGQMETVLTLEPGRYTLRLLLADAKHLPHFVYSKPVNITVTRKNAEIDPKSLVVKGIALLNLSPDVLLRPPFRVQFQASGLNVAHLTQNEKDTGHFRLTVTPQKGGKPAEMDFIDGQTETWLAPPSGAYTLKLDFMDNVMVGKPLTAAVTAQIRVE